MLLPVYVFWGDCLSQLGSKNCRSLFLSVGFVLVVLLIGVLFFPLFVRSVSSVNLELIFVDDFNDGNNDGWTEHLGSWDVIDGEYFVSVGMVENGITCLDSLELVY